MGSLTPDLVRSLLDYDHATGVLRWRARTVSLFRDGIRSAVHNCAAWNAKNAGKVAGAPDKDGYLQVGVFGRNYKAHRLAWAHATGQWPTKQIDHRNLNKADNSFANLREATQSQNNANRRAATKNKTGLKGISFDRANHKWMATIKDNGRHINLGRFSCPVAAHFAYIIAADKIHGEFARAG